MTPARRLLLVLFLAAGWAGADPPAPGTSTSVIPEGVIRSAVEGYVRQQVEEATAAQAADGAAGTEVRHEIGVRWQGDILLDEPAAVDFQVQRLSDRPFRGPTVVRVELRADGRLLRALTVTVDCRQFRDVVVARRAVRRGEELSAQGAGLAVEERDVTGLKHGCFADLAELSGMRAARPVGAGDIVTAQHVEAVPVVHRGDDVVVALRTGTMSLLVTGIALEDGGAGARIRVRNVDSGKVVFAEVVDADTVRVGW